MIGGEDHDLELELGSVAQLAVARRDGDLEDVALGRRAGHELALDRFLDRAGEGLSSGGGAVGVAARCLPDRVLPAAVLVRGDDRGDRGEAVQPVVAIDDLGDVVDVLQIEDGVDQRGVEPEGIPGRKPEVARGALGAHVPGSASLRADIVPLLAARLDRIDVVLGLLLGGGQLFRGGDRRGRSGRRVDLDNHHVAHLGLRAVLRDLSVDVGVGDLDAVLVGVLLERLLLGQLTQRVLVEGRRILFRRQGARQRRVLIRGDAGLIAEHLVVRGQALVAGQVHRGPVADRVLADGHAVDGRDRNAVVRVPVGEQHASQQCHGRHTGESEGDVEEDRAPRIHLAGSAARGLHGGKVIWASWYELVPARRAGVTRPYATAFHRAAGRRRGFGRQRRQCAISKKSRS